MISKGRATGNKEQAMLDITKLERKLLSTQGNSAAMEKIEAKKESKESQLRAVTRVRIKENGKKGTIDWRFHHNNDATSFG